MASLGCGKHTAYVYTRGGGTMVMELPNLITVTWERVRDDISSALARVGVTPGCCEQLSQVRSVVHELHIYRDNELVWLGPITRIEYSRGQIEFWATDILWVAKHTALSQGYSNKYPNIGSAGARMYWLMADQTFAKYGDPWRARNAVRRIVGPDEPRTSRSVNAWSSTTWEDFDKFAQDGGMDYTVVGRSVMFWDIHYRWRTLPPLQQDYLFEDFRLVEYGSQFQNRAVVTDGSGKAGIYQSPSSSIMSTYGHVDLVTNVSSDAEPTEDVTDSDKALAEAENVAAWTDRARALVDSAPRPPLYVLVPENSALVPEAPYPISSLVPGSWLQVNTAGFCRSSGDTWHRLHEVSVEESAGKETVKISLIPAPTKVVT